MPLMLFYFAYFFVTSIYVVVNMYLQVVFYNFGYGFEYVGLFQAVFEAAGIIGPILLGALADRKGWYKQLCIITLLVSGIAFYMLATDISLILIFVSLLFFGFSFRAVSPIFDSFGTLSLGTKSERYSVYRAFGTLGFLIISAILAFFHKPDVDSNANISFYYSLIVVVSTFFVIILPTKDLKKNKALLEAKNEGRTRVEKEGKWYTKGFVIAMILIAFSRFSMTAIYSFLSLYSIEVVKYENITMLNVVGSAFEFFIILLSGKLVKEKKITPYTLIMIGTLAVAVRYFIYVLFPSVAGILVGQALHCFCYGALHIGAILYITKNVREDHRAMGLGIYYAAATGLPAVIGSYLGGQIVANYGYNALFSSYAGVCLVALVFGLIFKKTLRADSPFLIEN